VSTAINEVREALHAALVDDDALMDLCPGGVWDEQAVEGTPFPYIVLGGTAEDDGRSLFGHDDRQGGEAIRIFTRPAQGEVPGARQAKQIYARLVDLLGSGGALALANGWKLYGQRLRLVTTFLEPDRKTTAAPVEFSYRVMR